MAAARAGDPDAFDRLLRPLLGGLLSLARRLAPPGFGEELLQEALLRAYRGFGGYRGEGRLSAWIARILFRLAAEPERFAGRRRELALPSAEELPAALGGDPAAGACARDELRRVEAAMERLPLRQRTALHLRAVEGFGYAEIARVLGTSEGAARNAVLRARRRLRERLEDVL